MSGYALIVDNDGIWLDFLSRAVDRVGLKHDLASTHYRAIELIKKKKYTVALIDADLGTELGTNGCSEILAELKANGSEIPVVIVSGLEDIKSLTQNLARHYPNLRDFTKGENLMDLQTLVLEITGGTFRPQGFHAVDLSDLVDSVSYEFAFLKLDIAGHSAIVRANRGPDVEETLEAFEKLVESEITSFQGHILSWQGDGGLSMFFSGDKVANSIEAAFQILYGLRKFNDNDNKTTEEIKLRIACHQGVAKFKTAYGRIHSSAINFVCHLEAKGTSINSIAISEAFYKELPQKIKARFVAKGGFEDSNIYEYTLPNADKISKRAPRG